ncbi:MAG: glycosyltransferase [Planctomycetaceae bacterium]|nr:glycosyltransferase [Planctomycetaceae bacterium]
MSVSFASVSTSPGPNLAMPPGRQRISLVLPAHNEEPVIRQAVTEAVAALAALDIDFEVLVIDDDSTDGTRQAALDASRPFPQVRVIALEKNVGYAGALRRGFREARYELVGFTDADCQFDLREIEKLLKLARTADIACGIRVDRQDPWRRKVYSKGFNILARALLGTTVQDCDCALKIFRRDWVNAAGLEAEGFFFNAELLARAHQAGLRVAEVGVTHRPRAAGESKVSIGHVLPVLRTLIVFWWSQVMFSRPVSHRAAAERPNRQKLVLGTLFLALAAALVILPKLTYPLLDPDESRYAQIAREMLDSGDLVIPTRHGKPYLDKPPLLYWLTTASYATFGVSEIAARLVASLAAIGTVLCTFWIGRYLVGLRAAWIGAFLQVNCVGIMLCGRFLFMDSLLTLFTTVSLLAGYAACRGGKFRLIPWVCAAIACGLGTLTKGPVAPVLCLPPLWLSCWLTQGGAPLRWRHWAGYAAIAGAVAVPWFVLMAIQEPQAFVDFIWTHHFDRFVSGLSHEEPFWFYVPVLLVAMLPVSIMIPAVFTFLARVGSAARPYRTWDVGYLLLFSAWTLALFSASSCKLPPYILPIIPAMCLVFGTTLAAILSGKTNHPFLAYVRQNSPRDVIGILCFGPLILAIVDYCLLGEQSRIRFVDYAILMTIGVLLFVALKRNHLLRTKTRWGAGAIYGMLVLSYGTMEFTSAIATNRCKVTPVEEFCRDEIQHAMPIVCISLAHEEDAFKFYFHGLEVRAYQWDQMDDAIAAMHDAPRTLVFVDVYEIERLQQRLSSDLRFVELGRHEHIVVGKTEPFSSEPPEPLALPLEGPRVTGTRR